MNDNLRLKPWLERLHRSCSTHPGAKRTHSPARSCISNATNMSFTFVVYALRSCRQHGKAFLITEMSPIYNLVLIG